WYSKRTIGEQNELRKRLANFKIPKGSNPVEQLQVAEDLGAEMKEAGIPVEDQQIYSTFVSALPFAEYHLEIRELGRETVLQREQIVNLVRPQYELLRRNKKSSSSDYALITGGGRGGGGWRGRGGAKRGGRGGSRGGGHGNRGSSNGGKKPGGSGVAADTKSGAAADTETSSAKVPVCWNCHERGHFQRDCKV
ncbi:unnamed protein product, partial [Pylaiella littoralis]